jgi:hypothetical protein
MPTEDQIATVIRETGMDRMQAIYHLRGRQALIDKYARSRKWAPSDYGRNLNDSPSLGPLTADDLPAPTVIKTRRGIIGKVARWVQIEDWRWHLGVLRAERDHFASAGAAGPIYLRESRREERRILDRIGSLEQS